MAEAIQHSFLLHIEHPPLGLRQMFRMSEACDLYETAATRKGSQPILTVDVEDAGVRATVLHLTPTVPMTYAEMADEVDEMLDSVGKTIGIQSPTCSNIDWLVDRKGVRSDQRRGMGSIR